VLVDMGGGGVWGGGLVNRINMNKINTLKSSVMARLLGLRQSTKFPDPITPVFSVDSIPSVTSTEAFKLFSNFTNKSSPVDFVPTSLLKSYRSTFLRASAMLKHVIAIGWTSVCLSVCLSVCHTLAPYQNG